MTAPEVDPIAGLGGIVLAGGKSSRMGTPKAWLDFGGEALLARVVRTIAEVCAPIVVVAAPGQDLPRLPDAVAIARDPVSGRGPLQGMEVGLSVLEGQARAAYISSTDAPFLSPALIRRLHALRGDGYDVAVPRVRGHYHPLSAIYTIEARAVIASLLAVDKLRPFFVFERMQTIVAEEEILLEDEALRTADPALQSLENVNTPEEYRTALTKRTGRD